MTPRLGSLLAATLVAGCYAGADEPAAAPRSLAGTEIDGEFRTAAGAFVFDADARRGFDYFLTAADELEPAALDAWVRAALAERLPAAAADEAFAAWQDYVAYRAEAAALLTDAERPIAEVETALLRLAADALAAWPIADVAQKEVAQAFAARRALTSAGDDRDAALASLAAADEFAASDAGAFLAGRRATTLAQLAGADAADLAAVRSEHFGPDAAARLAALDARRAAWTLRVDEFKKARDAALAGFTGTAAERTAIVDALVADRFTPAEARRLHAQQRLAE